MPGWLLPPIARIIEIIGMIEVVELISRVIIMRVRGHRSESIRSGLIVVRLQSLFNVQSAMCD